MNLGRQCKILTRNSARKIYILKNKQTNLGNEKYSKSNEKYRVKTQQQTNQADEKKYLNLKVELLK